MKSMFAMRANDRLRSMPGTFHALTPLQLACKLGDHDMFQHIMRRQSVVVWKWGPVTQYQIDLEGIDSSGTGANDVMELIGRLDASRSTQEMLLDSFIQGFIHKIFEQKWVRFGRAAHNVLMFFNTLFIVSLATMALWLKEDPEGLLQNRWLAVVTMLTMIPSEHTTHAHTRHIPPRGTSSGPSYPPHVLAPHSSTLTPHPSPRRRHPR